MTPSANRSTVYDVARRANVSTATVSRVLNSPELVRQETRARVMQAIDELGFVPKADATARARKEFGRIGVLTPFFTSFSFVQRMRGIAAELRDEPYELIIYPVDSLDRLDGYLNMLAVTRRLDGLIIISLPLSKESAHRLLGNHLETVLIEVDHAGFGAILIDDLEGGRLAAQHLLARGRQRCAFFGVGDLPNYALRPEDKRLEGFRGELEREGVSLPPEYIQRPRYGARTVLDEFCRVMRLPEPPTGIFASSDLLAIQVLGAARACGVSVPRDLAVIGFDDIDTAEQIGLTTITQSLDESGRMAADLLLARMADATRPTQHIKIGLRVISRETT
jgi:LacI family transcriptional regulator